MDYNTAIAVVTHTDSKIPYFSAHCISDHCISKPNPNHNPNPNPKPDKSPDHDCSHLLVRDAVVRNAVGTKGGHHSKRQCRYCLIELAILLTHFMNEYFSSFDDIQFFHTLSSISRDV